MEAPAPLAAAASNRIGGFLAGLAWLAVLVVVGLSLVASSGGGAAGPESAGAGAGESMESVLARIQGRVLVGVADLTGQREDVWTQAGPLRGGSVSQRLRFAALAGELKGPETVREELTALDLAIAGRLATGDATPISDDEAATRAVLGRLYPPDDPEGVAAPARLGALDEADRAQLEATLGWFGRLALAPPGSDAAARAAVIGTARTAAIIFYAAIFVGGAAALGGFLGLIAMIVLGACRLLRARFRPGSRPAGIWIECFAIWLLLFIAGQALLGLVPLAPALQLPAVAVVFFLSLAALAWPVLRGVPLREVTAAIGWSPGAGVVREVLCGLGGYAMALPILAVGLAMTLVLLALDALMRGAPEPLAPQSGPAHPIIEELGSGRLPAILAVLVIGSIAAPIVEETMFRGVLYRHLRESTRGARTLVSVALATLVNTFVFAAIHPQGWIAIPALMSLATAFTLAREWRGSLIAPIVMHATSNGLILTTVSLLARP